MEMRALYYIALPTGKDRNVDSVDYESDIKANENCLNQNFRLIADKLYELEIALDAIRSNSQSKA